MSEIRTHIVAALQASTVRFEASAKRMAEERKADFAAELVNQKRAAIEFRANLAALKTADKMTKQLLDIVA